MNKKYRMAPLIRWPGGQSREVKKLMPYFPEHETYVEPFAGGASFFFGKDRVPEEVLGDTSPWLMKFYDDVRKGKAQGCKINYSERSFRQALKRKDACSKLKLSAMGYGGFLGARHGYLDKTSGHRNGKALYTLKMKRLPIYERRLRNAWLTTGGFARTMKKFDHKRAFHLLDPPWPENHSDKYYGNKDSEVTPYDVAKVGAKMKGTVWVLYNDHEDVKDAFRGRKWHIYRVKTRAFHKHKGGQGQGYTKLLITNRPLRRRR